MAATLAHSWRQHCASSIDLTPAELARAAPLLSGCGAAALAWRQLERSQTLRGLRAADDLHQAARILALEEVRNTRAVEHVALILNGAGMEPLLFKGWAVARYYPEAYLRPYGDIDLCAPPGRYTAAAASLAAASLPGYGIGDGDFFIDCGPRAKVCRVDLHSDLQKHHMPDTAVLFERSVAVCVGAARVRLMSAEDQLRHVVSHFFRHGGVRALWLCDIAAMIEAASEDFDWALCLHGDPRARDWVQVGASLAAQLLHCELGHAPALATGGAAPRWLTHAVLRAWARSNRSPTVAATRRLPARARDVLPWLRARWPSPVQATIARRGSLRGGRHRLHQAAEVTTLATRWLAKMASAEWSRAKHRAQNTGR